MLQQQRHDIILSILAENGTVHTADLVKRMDVSSETIRKDLDYLEKAGQLTRVHGGAMPASDRDSAINPGYITLSTRKTQNVEQKKAIVQYALSMIEELRQHQSVDGGSPERTFSKAEHYHKFHSKRFAPFRCSGLYHHLGRRRSEQG